MGSLKIRRSILKDTAREMRRMRQGHVPALTVILGEPERQVLAVAVSRQAAERWLANNQGLHRGMYELVDFEVQI